MLGIDWRPTGPELTALANGAWQGSLAMGAALAVSIWLRLRPSLDASVREAVTWAPVACLSWYGHRCFWNIALLLDDPSEPGDYHLGLVEHKHWLILLVLLGIYAGWRTVRPLLPRSWVRPAAIGLALSVVAHAVAWPLMMRLLS